MVFINSKERALNNLQELDPYNCEDFYSKINNYFLKDFSYKVIDYKINNSIIYAVCTVYTNEKILTGIGEGPCCESLIVVINKSIINALSFGGFLNANNKKEACEYHNLKDLRTSKEKETKKIEISKNQIDLINKFKIDKNIDSDLKFERYIQVFSQSSIYDLRTKKDLVDAGSLVIDEFLNWTSKIDSLDLINTEGISLC